MKKYFPVIISLLMICLFSGLSAQHKKLSGTKIIAASDSIDVINYSIHLNLVYLSTKTISGYTKVSLCPKYDNTTSVSLDLLKLNVDSVFIESVKTTGFSYNDTLLKISLYSPINTTDTIDILVYYHGIPKVDASGWGGFYFNSDSTFAYNLGVGFQAEPHNYGRVWFPCADNFTDRSTYNCFITVKNDKAAVCGGTLLNTSDNGNGTKTYSWRISNIIPTYLASVAVGNYVPVSFVHNALNGPLPVKIYVRPQDTTKAKNSFVHLPNIIDYFESKFGPYQWERVGFVGVPFNDGAMEHATNIAYPLARIDGGLTYESLYAHEFSHHWFGDLVTCATAEDMWINEGWASYCEPLFEEGLYGKASYDANVKSNHYYVLNKAHVEDGGYYAVYGIPSAITYGTTVYQKGADVIHTLRNYMEDSLFFASAKALMNTYKFKDISTTDFRDFFSQQSGIDLIAFFDGWIMSPGFPHFSIDSVVHEGSGNDYRVYARQRLHHKPAFVNSNKVEITFMSNSWQKNTQTISFSGEYGNQLFSLPFTPAAAMIDLYEKTSDATTDYYKVLKVTGINSFTNSYFTLDVKNINDSAFFRVEHNWVAPDTAVDQQSEIYRISRTHYWKIDGIFPIGFSAQGKFIYNRYSSGFDNSLLPTTASTDSLILLFRASTADKWQMVNFIRTGNLSMGSLITDTLKKGEYTFGIGSPVLSGIQEADPDNYSLKIYPNPSNDFFNISYKISLNSELFVLDINNKIIDSISLSAKKELVAWKPKHKASTTYFFKIVCNNKTIASEKAMMIK